MRFGPRITGECIKEQSKEYRMPDKVPGAGRRPSAAQRRVAPLVRRVGAALELEMASDTVRLTVGIERLVE